MLHMLCTCYLERLVKNVEIDDEQRCETPLPVSHWKVRKLGKAETTEKHPDQIAPRQKKVIGRWIQGDAVEKKGSPFM